ncbi:MAG TPA: ComEA family DNA-binding protein [Candidatus Woesebacteria bacterium]|nr:ComEA family DNA-binding protein [Candidatus Woesebacteria bacterium]
MSFIFLTRLASATKELVSLSGGQWRTLVSLVLLVAGLGCVCWGGYELVVIAEVPHCAYSTKEQLADSISEGQDASNSSDQTNSAERELSANVQIGMVQIEVFGAVAQPGVFYLPSDARIIDAINIAGGLTDQADQERLHQQLNMAQKISDEQKIRVPSIQDQTLTEKLTLYCRNLTEIEKLSAQTDQKEQQSYAWFDETTTQNEANSQAEETADTTNKCISINSASSNQLQTLSGVGEKTAELIIAGRPYLKIDDLTSVKGIGEATLQKLEPFICL